MTNTDWSTWSNLQWRRRLETFGEDDASIIAKGSDEKLDGIWCAFRVRGVTMDNDANLVIASWVN